jgi:hypothetical protein
VVDRPTRGNSETEGIFGKLKRMVHDRFACRPTVRRAKPLGDRGRTWSQGGTWMREACGVAQIGKEGGGAWIA